MRRSFDGLARMVETPVLACVGVMTLALPVANNGLPVFVRLPLVFFLAVVFIAVFWSTENLLNPSLLSDSLENDNMTRNSYDEILYGNAKGRSPNFDPMRPYGRTVWPGDYKSHAREEPYPSFFSLYRSGQPPLVDESLASRVFGRQLAEKHVALRHGDHLAKQQERIHRPHLAELDTQRNHLLNRLSFANRPYRVGPPQQVVQLERLLFQLESERQRTERFFWKDMADLQKDLFATAFAYQAAKDRYALFGGLERGDG